MNSKQSGHSGAQYAFLYMLSLVSLIFLALSVGIVAFQYINKFILDIAASREARFSADAIKFAISAIIISCPVYYLTISKINKALFKGDLDNNSGIRRWLSYFILFVSSVIVLGYLIGILYSFLDGELTLKFALKSLTAIIISGTSFSYYFYDLKRKKTKGVKDKIIKSFFYSTAVVVLIALTAAFFIMDSPQVVREKKMDQDTVRKLQNLEGRIIDYYYNNKKLPQTFEDLKKDFASSLMDKDFRDKETGKKFEYNLLSDTSYELCAWFRLGNNDEEDHYAEYQRSWNYKEGRNCFKRTIKQLEGFPSPKVIRE